MLRLRDWVVFESPSTAANYGYSSTFVKEGFIDEENNRTSGYEFLHLPNAQCLREVFCQEKGFPWKSKAKGIYKKTGKYSSKPENKKTKLVDIKKERDGKEETSEEDQTQSLSEEEEESVKRPKKKGKKPTFNEQIGDAVELYKFFAEEINIGEKGALETTQLLIKNGYTLKNLGEVDADFLEEEIGMNLEVKMRIYDALKKKAAESPKEKEKPKNKKDPKKKQQLKDFVADQSSLGKVGSCNEQAVEALAGLMKGFPFLNGKGFVANPACVM